MSTPPRPERIKIGHARYAVEANPDACEAGDAEGLSAGNTLQIIIRNDRPHDALAETLLHEVLHQCLFQAGLDCTRIGENGLTGRDAEEVLVRAMSGTLLGTLRENRDLVTWLLHADQS